MSFVAMVERMGRCAVPGLLDLPTVSNLEALSWALSSDNNADS